MMYYSDDPARDAERYMADLEKRLSRRPVCDWCGEHIQQDTAFHYKGIWLCDDCIDWLKEGIEVDE